MFDPLSLFLSHKNSYLLKVFLLFNKNCKLNHVAVWVSVTRYSNNKKTWPADMYVNVELNNEQTV